MAPSPILWLDRGFFSPWGLSVFTLLKEKGIPFTLKTVDLYHPSSEADEYAGRVPTGKIPSLQHDGMWIAESLAILEYLEEAYPAPRFPSLFARELTERTRERELLSWLRTDLFELRRCLPFEGMFLAMERPTITDEAREEVQTLLNRARSSIRNDRAASPRIADFELSFALRRLIHYGIDLSRENDVRAFANSLWERPSVQEWVRQDRSQTLT